MPNIGFTSENNYTSDSYETPVFLNVRVIQKEGLKLTQVITSALGFQLLKSPISVAHCKCSKNSNIIKTNSEKINCGTFHFHFHFYFLFIYYVE